ncbi:TPA: hypothetical protein I6W52_003197 [Vibrio cholerae]|nr:hypothetical protein [Vibrio cholerae]
MNENKDYPLLRVSYDKRDFIDDETLQKYYGGDIVTYLKQLLEEDGRYGFIDWFEIEDIVEGK